MDMSELKTLLQAQGEAFEEFKRANDARLAALADGKAVGDLEAKVAALGEALDAIGDAIVRLQRRALPLTRRPPPSRPSASSGTKRCAVTFRARASWRRPNSTRRPMARTSPPSSRWLGTAMSSC